MALAVVTFPLISVSLIRPQTAELLPFFMSNSRRVHQVAFFCSLVANRTQQVAFGRTFFCTQGHCSSFWAIYDLSSLKKNTLTSKEKTFSELMAWFPLRLQQREHPSPSTPPLPPRWRGSGAATCTTARSGSPPTLPTTPSSKPSCGRRAVS